MARLIIFRNTDGGAPALSGTAGDLVNVLDKCLVTGYSGSVTSITRSGGTATVTTPVAHNLLTGQSVIISGANETDYNGTFTVTVLTNVTFSYTIPGTPSTPATGTLLFSRGNAGWTKPFTGTNKAAFKQGAGSNGMYLRVQDDAPGAGGAKEARITGYEVMTTIDAGTNPFPSAAQGVGGIAMLVARKSTTADATARDWLIAADARTFYMLVKSEVAVAAAGNQLTFGFGEFYSFKLNDSYRVLIIGRDTENNAGANQDFLFRADGLISTATGAHFMPRGHNGTYGPIQLSKTGDMVKNNSTGGPNGVIPYTNPEDGGLYLSPYWLSNPTTAPANGLIGRMRGLYQFLHAVASVNDGDVASGGASGEFRGKTFLFSKTCTSSGAQTGTGVIETSNTLETN